MYSCVTCDAIKSNVKARACAACGVVEDGHDAALQTTGLGVDIVGRLVPVHDLPTQERFLANHPAGTAQWTSSCPLPRVICMNLMLPYETGIVPWRSEDPGASFVAFFHISPETVMLSTSKDPPPEVKQLIDFFAGPSGLPLGPRGDPDRSLASRLQPGPLAQPWRSQALAPVLVENLWKSTISRWFSGENSWISGEKL
eukprot:Skav218589  [mRNA]  locus=scaffold5304:39365:47091:- [translate_table: standard]